LFHIERYETVNIPLRNQNTIRQNVTVEGFGYWTGRDVRVEFRPAEADTGIVFIRDDLPQPVAIPALASHRIEIPRRTSLSVNGVTVEMVEHIMAALAGLQVDNCEVWVDQPEMPGCDGSALAFVEAIDSVGIVEQDVPRSYLVVRESTRTGDENAWIEAQTAKKNPLTLRFRIDYGNDNDIGRQTYELPITPDTFRKELAPCRTFMLEKEADQLVSMGLGKRVTPKDLLVFGQDGPIDNELRFEDECVRHKLLDLVGDLALAGCDLSGHFVAYCSGHRLNAELVKSLLAEGVIESGRLRSIA
jgi:UDP-3-O-[3-hydroxymyristoyl] N-acetylglucosamine deacetylase